MMRHHDLDRSTVCAINWAMALSTIALAALAMGTIANIWGLPQ